MGFAVQIWNVKLRILSQVLGFKIWIWISNLSTRIWMYTVSNLTQIRGGESEDFLASPNKENTTQMHDFWKFWGDQIYLWSALHSQWSKCAAKQWIRISPSSELPWVPSSARRHTSNFFLFVSFPQFWWDFFTNKQFFSFVESLVNFIFRGKKQFFICLAAYSVL